MVCCLLMLPVGRAKAEQGKVANGQLERFVLTMAWSAQAEFAGYYVAKEKGFYRDAGLDVVFQYPSLSSSVYYRAENDSCDAGIYALMSAIDITSKGIPMVNIFQSSMNSSYLIVSRWGENPAKLKNKRLAVYRSEPNYMASIMDKQQKMNFEWIYFTSNVHVFLSGGVDALAMVSYSELLLLKQAGFKMKEEQMYRFKDHGYNIQENGVYMKREVYAKRRGAAQKFAAATRRGWEWAAAHPEEAVEIVLKVMRKHEVPTNRVIQKLMLQEILNLQKDPDSGRREYRLRPDMVKKASQMMKECGMIDRIVTYQELIGK